MSKRTVYLIVGGYDYEGYNIPAGVFSTKKKAQNFLRDIGARGDTVEIYKFTIDPTKEYYPDLVR